MITFRYHIVSIVSVFLALAVGVALGGGPLKGEVDNTLVEQVKTDRAAKADLTAQIAGLRASNTFTDEFATTVAATLVGTTLKGRTVTLVVLPTAAQADVKGAAELIGVAGGTVGGTAAGRRPPRGPVREAAGRGARPAAREPGQGAHGGSGRRPLRADGRPAGARLRHRRTRGRPPTAPPRPSWPG